VVAAARLAAPAQSLLLGALALAVGLANGYAARRARRSRLAPESAFAFGVAAAAAWLAPANRLDPIHAKSTPGQVAEGGAHPVRTPSAGSMPPSRAILFRLGEPGAGGAGLDFVEASIPAGHSDFAQTF